MPREMSAIPSSLCRQEDLRLPWLEQDGQKNHNLRRLYTMSMASFNEDRRPRAAPWAYGNSRERDVSVVYS